ncbi:unnamed protein product [Rhizoctonia solani]|uniref:RNA helicase n=1 Tax=Rhizoctonia solani TaxID=456999 RepID=A0A8H3ALJ1_9AGAM|nr:unnamed protein product [Rhizoctonia solani]
MAAVGEDYLEGHSGSSVGRSTTPSTSTTSTQVLEATIRNIPRLKEQNYTQWKAVITHSIKSAKLWGYIDGSIEEPSRQNASELIKYMSEAGAVRNAILGSLESGAQKYIEEALTPRDAWLALEKQYLTTGHDARLIAIEQQLANLKLEQGGDVVQHIADFCRLRRHLNDTRFALDDRASGRMMYRSLTTEYRQWILAQEHTEMEDFGAFCKLLESHYRSVTGSDANIPTVFDSGIAPAECILAWGVPEDLKAFGLTGSKNPLLEKRAAVTCRDCLLKGHEAATPECPQYEWRRELWGSPHEDKKQLPNASEGMNPRTPSDHPASGAKRGNKMFTYEFSEPVRATLSFKELELNERLTEAFYHSVPHGIQQCAILPAVAGKSIIAQAPPETGKTTAMVISIAQTIDTGKQGIQALILTPTENKVIETRSIITSLGYNCYASTSNQPFGGGLDQLAEGHRCSIFIGTPEHLIQLSHRGVLCTSGVKTLVLDDLDMLIDNGFNRHLSDIYLSLPHSVQTLGTCTTLSSETLREVDRYMHNPLYITITVDQDKIVLQTMTHAFVTIPRHDDKNHAQPPKLSMLEKLFKNSKIECKIGVLCDTPTEVWGIKSKLDQDRWYDYCSTNENMTSEDYQAAIAIFRNSQRRHLLTTTAKPLKRKLNNWNIKKLWIVNYNIPSSSQNYIKRLSYLGVCQGTNVAINLVNEGTDEINMIREIERHFGIRMVELAWRGDNFY